MDNEPENQDWRKFGEGGKNRWKKDEKMWKKMKNMQQSVHTIKQ